MDRLLEAIERFGAENGIAIAVFIINLAKDLAGFYEPMMWVFAVCSFLLFVSLAFDIKSRSAREASGQRLTTGGMLSKLVGCTLLAQLSVFADSFAESAAGEGVTVMRPYGYVEQMSGSADRVWGDMLLGVMVIITLMSWFYVGKALWMFSTLDAAQDREGRLYGAMYTVVAATLLLIIMDLVKAFAASGGVDIETLGNGF